jgi:hypothetical protein
MVNIFDTYINNSEREQRTNNIRNNILYNHFNNIYGNINNNRNTNINNSNETKSNEEPTNNEEETKNNEQTTPETNNYDVEYVYQFITENNINSFIENSPIFNIFRNISANIEIDSPEIINSNDFFNNPNYISYINRCKGTFVIPISGINVSSSSNFIILDSIDIYFYIYS